MPVGRSAWVQAVSDYEVSGLTQEAYADSKGIGVASLRYWIYKLRRESPRLLPATVVGSAAPTARCSEGRWIELRLESGAVLRFESGTDPQYLSRLITSLTC